MRHQHAGLSALNMEVEELAHADGREEQRAYWAKKTFVERLMGMWELNRREASLRGIDLDRSATTWTVQLVRHKSDRSSRLKHLLDAKELELIPDE